MWDGSDFLFKGSCKTPQAKPKEETQHVTISKVLPQQLPCSILEATLWEQAGLRLWFLLYRRWNWGLEKTRTQGRRRSGKVGADHGFPITTPLSPHQSTLYLAKWTFHKTRLAWAPCEYIHIYQSKLYFHVSSVSIHLCNLLPVIDSHHLLAFL